MSVVGFDFGYQSCCIAVAKSGGIEVITNDYSLRNTPSCVAFHEKNRSMGQAAKQQLITNFKNTVWGWKKLISRPYDDTQVAIEKQRLPYEIMKQKDGSIGIKVNYLNENQVFSPEVITSMLLTKLKEITEAALGASVYDCVIAVPVFFTDVERRAILDAAHIAGLHCLKIINETTATALNYGIYKQDLPAVEEKPRNVAFVDMGHSALQCCICQFNKGKLKVLSVAFDPSIGGRDFDDVLTAHFCKEFKTKYKLDVKPKTRQWVRLGDECEKIKKLMSGTQNNIPLNIECFMDDKDVTGMMKRADFESMCTTLLSRVEQTLQRVLIDSKLKAEDIYSVEIVGGSTRIQAVKTLITNIFGKQPSTTLNADEAVARGAALQCAILSPAFRVREFSVTDYQPYSVSLVWTTPDNETEKMEIFEVGHAVPFSKMLTFYRKEAFKLEAIYTHPKAIPFPNSYIGTFTVKNISRKNNEDSAKVKVKVRINLHGLFLVSSASLIDKVDEQEQEEQENDMEVDNAGGELNDVNAAVSEPAQTQANTMDTDATATAANVNNDTAGGGDAEMNNINKDSPTGDTASPDTDVKVDGGKAAADDKTGSGSPKKIDKSSGKVVGVSKGKKVKSVDLPIEQACLSQLSKVQLDALVEFEGKLRAQDRLEREKSFIKNSLEEFVYEMRSKLSEQLDRFVVEQEKVKLMKSLDDTENWLYEEGEDESKKVYEERLANLQASCTDIVHRYNESTARPPAFEALAVGLQRIRKVVDAYKVKDEKYDHLSEEEMGKVEALMVEKQAWFDEKMNKQAQLAPHQQPIVLAKQIYDELKALEKFCNKIINKPKPKVEPPPAEPKKDEQQQQQETTQEQQGQAANGAEQPQGEQQQATNTGNGESQGQQQDMDVE